MNETDLSAMYQSKADEIIKHYNTLVLAVKKFLFLWKFKTLDWLPDSTKWPTLKKIFFAFFMPMAIFDSDYYDFIGLKFIPFVILAVSTWLCYFFVLYIVGLASLSLFLVVPPALLASQGGSISSPQFSLCRFISIYIIGLLLYIPILWYWFNKKTTWKSRFLYLVFILITIYFFPLKIGVVKIGNTGIAVNLSNLIYKELFISLSYIIWIPFILSSAWIFLTIMKLLFNSLSDVSIYFQKAHSTDYSVFIKKLISEPIEIHENILFLASLPASEIAALKEQAQNSLDATDKKTIPTIIFFSLLTIMITYVPTQHLIIYISTALANLTIVIIHQYSPNLQAFNISFLMIGIVEFMMLFTVLALGIFLQIFENLYIQGIIIEACTIAEYAKLETEKERIKQEQPRSPWQTILDLFFGKK